MLRVAIRSIVHLLKGRADPDMLIAHVQSQLCEGS
jgi:hypothetical protein